MKILTIFCALGAALFISGCATSGGVQAGGTDAHGGSHAGSKRKVGAEASATAR